MSKEIVTMASTDAMRERIAAHPWPRGGVEVIRANRGYTLYSQRTGGQVARLRPTVRMMTSGSCGGVARAGPRRATSDPLSCRSTRRSTSSPPRASSGSVLNLQSVTKCANSSLVVHPLSYCDFWRDGDPGAARGAVPPSTTPDEGVLVLVPVRGGAADGFFDLGPGLEAATLQRQRAQDLPPRLDQVEVGGILGLEHELPARVRECEQEHIGGTMEVEVVHYRVDPLDPGVDPALDRAEEIDPVRGGAALVCFRKCIPCGRSESTEDVALAASAVVDLLLGPLRFGTGRLDHAPAGIAPGGLRSHLVEADD